MNRLTHGPGCMKAPTIWATYHLSQISDVVLFVDDGFRRRKWRMGQVISTFPDPNGVVRQVEVKIDFGVLRRLIVKLCLICKSNQASTNGPFVSDQ